MCDLDQCPLYGDIIKSQEPLQLDWPEWSLALPLTSSLLISTFNFIKSPFLYYSIGLVINETIYTIT